MSPSEKELGAAPVLNGSSEKKSQRLKGLLSKARSAIDKSRKIGADVATAENLLANANSHYKSKELEAATECALSAKREAENANKYRKGELQILHAENSISEAVKDGVELAKGRELIGKARESLESALYGQATEFVSQAKTAIAEAKRNHHTGSLIARVSEIAGELQKKGCQVENIMTNINEARASLDRGEHGIARNLVAKTRKLIKESQKHRNVELAVIELEDEIEEAGKMGVDISETDELLRAAQQSLEARDYEKTKSSVRKAKRILRRERKRKENEILIRTIESLIDSAGKGGVNLLKAKNLLGHIRKAINDGTVAELSRIAPTEYPDVMRRFDEWRASLRNHIEEARILNIDTRHAEDFLCKAEESIAGMDESQLELCIDQISRAAKTLIDSLLRTYKERIALVREDVANANKLGLMVTNAEKALSSAEESLGSQEFPKTMESIKIADGILEALFAEYVDRKGRALELMLQALPMSSQSETDYSDAKAILLEAQQKSSDPKSAALKLHDTALNIETSLKAMVADGISRAKEELNRSNGLNLNTQGIETVLKRAENALEFDLCIEAMESVVVVENLLDSLNLQYMFDQYHDRIEALKKEIQRARKSGLDMEKAEELVAESKKALLSNELGNIESMLSDAANLIEDKKRESSLSRVKGEMDRLSIALVNARVMGTDTSDAERSLAGARESLERGESPDVVNAELKNSNRMLEDSIKMRLEASLSETQHRVQEAISKGADVAGVGQISMKAREAFENADYLKSFNLIKDSEEELNRVLLSLRSRDALSKLEETRAVINGAELEGSEMTELNALVEESTHALNKGEFERSSELSERARTTVESKRRKHVWEAASAEAGALNQALGKLREAGIDVDWRSDARPEVRNGISAETSDDALAGVLSDIKSMKTEIKERTSGLLMDAKKSLSLAKEMKLNVKEREKAIIECEALLESEDYIQCWINADRAKRMIEGSIRNHFMGAMRDRIGQVRDLLQKASMFMIEVEGAEPSIEDAEEELESLDLLNIEARKKANQFVSKAEKIVREVIASRIKDKEPKLTFNLTPIGVQAGSWSKCLLEVENNGALPATNVNVSLEGDLEVKGLKPISELAPMEKLVQEIGVMPGKTGMMPVGLTLSYHRIFDNSKYVVKGETNVRVAADKTYKVEDVFLISDDGRLISHVTAKCSDEMDEDIFSGMLMAVRAFVNDSFADGSKIGLKRLTFSEKNVLIEPGKNIFLTAVASGGEPSLLPLYMLEVIIEVQKKYGEVLEKWSGLLSDVQGIDDILRKLLLVTDNKDEGSEELEKGLVGSSLKALEEATKSGLELPESENFIGDMSGFAEIEDPESVMNRIHVALTEVRTMLQAGAPRRLVPTLTAEELRQYGGELLDDERLKEYLVTIKKIVECVSGAKEKEGLTQKWPIKRVAINSPSKDVMEVAKNFEAVIKHHTNAKRIDLIGSGDIWDGLKVEIIPNKEAIMKRYKQWPKIVLIISRVQSPMKMIEKVKEGKYAVGIDGMEIEITREMVDLKVSVPANVRECNNDWGKVYIDVEQDDDVKGEGFAEELVLKVNALKSTLAGGVRPKKLKIGARKELNALLSPFTDLIISKTSFENVALVTHEDLARKKPAKHTIRGEEFSIWMG